MIVTAAVFGLRPAGVQSLLCEQVELSAGQIRVLVESLKGRTFQQAKRRGAYSFYTPPPVSEHPLRVLGLLGRWSELRGAASGRWFERADMSASGLDAAVKRLVVAVGWAPPKGCQVSGHSLRILTFSQAALLSWSGARMQVRFNWKRVEDMGEIYMDHLARTSSASLAFFSPHLPKLILPRNAGAPGASPSSLSGAVGKVDDGSNRGSSGSAGSPPEVVEPALPSSSL